jgi:sarcosine oxidase gamma subunit
VIHAQAKPFTRRRLEESPDEIIPPAARCQRRSTRWKARDRICRTESPGQALVHAIEVAEQEERVRELQRQVGTVRVPGHVMFETAVHEMGPDRFHRLARRLVDVRSELESLVEAARTEVGERADDSRVE